MSRPSIITLIAAFIGLVCGAVLIVLWREQNVARHAHMKPPGASGGRKAASPASVAQSSDAEQRAMQADLVALLGSLERALMSRGVRDREAVIGFKDDAALHRFLARAHEEGLTILGRVDTLRTVRVRFNAFDSLQNELLGNASDYSAVSANNLFGIPQIPAKQDRANVDQVPFGNDAMAFVGATGDHSAWGRGTLIAILDTGVGSDATFGTGRVQALDIGLGTSPGRGSEDGHGTAIAALAAGAAPDAAGVAPSANLLSIRVTDANGTSDLFTISQAIVAATDSGAKIINISLGGYATGTVLDSAINYATQHGALIVAAAGNDQAAQLAWPAADPRVISVGAIDRAEQQVSFSNSGAQLQLTAPGYGVQTAWLDGRRVYVDGTSASAPIVSGSIAALMSQNPALTPQQAADLLARTANDGGAPGADAAFGHGIVNLRTAMNSSNPAYVDTAVSSHFYDAENHQMDFVVQNRSGRTVSGMSLDVNTSGATSSYSVPSLAPGESYVAKVPINEVALQAAGKLTFTTQLANPPGVTDQVPTNNKRSSVLSPPKN